MDTDLWLPRDRDEGKKGIFNNKGVYKRILCGDPKYKAVS